MSVGGFGADTPHFGPAVDQVRESGRRKRGASRGREVKRERRKREGEGEGDRGNTSEERENNNILYRCLH